jgi:hypothetical protein
MASEAAAADLTNLELVPQAVLLLVLVMLCLVELATVAAETGPMLTRRGC